MLKNIAQSKNYTDEIAMIMFVIALESSMQKARLPLITGKASIVIDALLSKMFANYLLPSRIESQIVDSMKFFLWVLGNLLDPTSLK